MSWWFILCSVRYTLLLLAAIALLRLPYTGYVWADEGLWFTAAEQLLRGRELYSGIWFDKPPLVAWTYAVLFWLAGPSLLAVRLFTVLYAGGVALALWHMGRVFWGEEEGRLAALLYALYNATYIHSQVQPMAVDHLVLLPCLYAGYFFYQGRPFPSGVLAAVAFAINAKAALLAPFFAVSEVLRRREALTNRWAWLAAGFAVGTFPWALYFASGTKWQYYLRDVWGWGFSYVSVYPLATVALTGARRVLNYTGFHASLFLGAALLVRFGRRDAPEGERRASHYLWLWLAFGFLGVGAGGRFFPRYFYQVLPLLCLLAARGCCAARSSGTRAWPVLRAILVAGVLFALVRFHARGAAAAYETLTGRQTAYMAGWHDPAIDRDSRLIARRVSGTLFVWGYRPEIYFYCRCVPGSSFLSSQPLTGVPADIQLRESRNVAPEFAAENRRRLLDELHSAPPDFIVDGLGPYNPALAMEAYPELRALLEQRYQRGAEVGHGVIYTLRRQ